VQAETQLAMCFKVDQKAAVTAVANTSSTPMEATISFDNENKTADARSNANGFSFHFSCGAAS